MAGKNENEEIQVDTPLTEDEEDASFNAGFGAEPEATKAAEPEVKAEVETPAPEPVVEQSQGVC